MLFNLLFFPLFLLAIMSLGSSFTYILFNLNNVGSRSHNEKIAMVGIGLQGILGLFFLGMISIIFNFFSSLTSIIFLSIIGILTVMGAFIFVRSITVNSITKIECYCFLTISFVIAFFASSLHPGYDGGLYHLPHQLWLRNESIVIGLANLHGRFGFGSIYEYISAPLWITKDNFILLSYLQASYIVFFALFLIEQSRHSHGTHQVLLSGIVVNILIFQGYMNFEYTYTDLPAGLTFVIAFLYGHWFLYRNNTIQRNEWSIFAILLLSAIFYKVSSILLIIWFVFVIFYRIVWKRDQLNECVIGLSIPIVFVLIWLLKNIITTGCLLYPMSSSCLELSWSAKINAINDAKWVTAWARHPASGLYSLQDIGWFSKWWLPQYISFLRELGFAGMLVGTLYGAFAVKEKFLSVKFSDIRYLGAVSFIVLSFIFWFWKAPTPRFGIGSFTLLFPVLLLFLYGAILEKSRKLEKILRIGVIAGLVLFSLRIGEPWKRISFNNALTMSILTVPYPKALCANISETLPNL